MKMRYNCLIIDDETDLAKMTAEYFNMFDIKTEYVNSAADAYSFLEENEADLILLDINLGDGSGFDVCKKLRDKMQLPILFKKPYSLSVLLAKVKVNLNRVEQLNALKEVNSNAENENGKPEKDGGSDLKKDEGTLILDEPTMSVILEGKRISLKAKEFALLKCLYDHKNTIVTKETLFDEVWGDSFYGDGTLNVHIRKLREKMEEDPNEPKMIKTIWGTGYMLEI